MSEAANGQKPQVFSPMSQGSLPGDFCPHEEVFPGRGGGLPWQRVTQLPAGSEIASGQAGPCMRMAALCGIHGAHGSFGGEQTSA